MRCYKAIPISLDMPTPNEANCHAYANTPFMFLSNWMHFPWGLFVCLFCETSTFLHNTVVLYCYSFVCRMTELCWNFKKQIILLFSNREAWLSVNDLCRVGSQSQGQTKHVKFMLVQAPNALLLCKPNLWQFRARERQEGGRNRMGGEQAKRWVGPGRWVEIWAARGPRNCACYIEDADLSSP